MYLPDAESASKQGYKSFLATVRENTFCISLSEQLINYRWVSWYLGSCPYALSFYAQCLSLTKTIRQRYPSPPDWTFLGTRIFFRIRNPSGQQSEAFRVQYNSRWPSLLQSHLPTWGSSAPVHFSMDTEFLYQTQQRHDRPLGYLTTASVIKMCCTNRDGFWTIWNLKEGSAVECLISLSFLRKRQLILRRQHFWDVRVPRIPTGQSTLRYQADGGDLLDLRALDKSIQSDHEGL